MESNRHYTYILKCSDGTFYTGYTNNLKKRIDIHNKKKGAKYTKGRLPVKLIYYEILFNKNDALKKEIKLKKMNKKQKINYINKNIFLKYIKTIKNDLKRE